MVILNVKIERFWAGLPPRPQSQQPGSEGLKILQNTDHRRALP
jgi:hypothetical protein